MIIKGSKNIKRYLYEDGKIEQPNGSNIVGDHDEDYVVDALFDIPNR